MNKTILTLYLGFLVSGIQAQTYVFTQLDANKVNATINTYGLLFHNTSTGRGGFETPKSSGRTTIYGQNLWIGGQNAIGQLHLAANNFSPETDFQPGPVMNPAHYAARVPLWNRLWKVTETEILNHIALHATPGYVVPISIASWPAHGDVAFGEPANVAPYVDANGNNTYDPVNGDYPLIKGTEAVYQVFNDYTTHSFSGTNPLEMEIHCMAYTYNCSSDSALQNTVFVNYRFINRSGNTYYNTYMGLASDMDLGFYLDDYMGMDMARGMMYAYNADIFDEAYSTNPGYDSILPVQGITLLAGPYSDADGADNNVESTYAAAAASGGICYPGLGHHYGDGVIDNERLGIRHAISYTGIGSPTAISDPSNGAEVYTMLKGMWKDATPVYYGGIGYTGLPGVTATPTDYMYFNDTDPLLAATHGSPVPASWNEITAGNPPGDRRGFGSCGPFTFAAGATHELDMAYTFARNYTVYNAPLAALPMLQQRVDDIRNYFTNGFPCGSAISGVAEAEKESIAFSVYPNPVSSQLTINFDKNTSGTYTLFDMTGQTVCAGNITSSNTTVDLSAVANGVYLVQVSSNQQKATQRIVVSK